jgi:glycosyltransferase involved in cell wall biosynthesis
MHRPGTGAGEYLAFLGRVSPEKRVDRAIEIARRAGWRLRIAAKVDRADSVYFDNVIRPLLSEPHVEFLGEISEAEKSEFLGDAAALLFPIDWPEPFGLVTIEALACGTPVIAFRAGSVEEIVEDGVSGFVVASVPEAVEAVAALDRLDRAACRQAFEKRFTAARMARDYVRIYREVVARGVGGRRARSGREATERRAIEREWARIVRGREPVCDSGDVGPAGPAHTSAQGRRDVRRAGPSGGHRAGRLR